MSEPTTNVRALWWAGPLTVGVSVAAVLSVQWLAVSRLDSPPPFLLGYAEPAVITAVLVAAGVVVFAIVSLEARHPAATFRRIALVALLVSLLPDVAVGMGWLFAREGWTLAGVFMTQHLAAWAITVNALPRLTAQG